MLLLLTFPLFNVHFPFALNIHSSFSETPTLLLAKRRTIYVLNRIARPLPCPASIISVLLIHNGLQHYLQTYIHRFALATVPKYPPIFFFLCDAYLLLTFPCDPSQTLGDNYGTTVTTLPIT